MKHRPLRRVVYDSTLGVEYEERCDTKALKKRI
jgi:hypothetical protein